MEVSVASKTYDGRRVSEVYETQPSKNLERVSANLSSVILDWCQKHIRQEFRMENLRAYIQFHGIRCAPASPDRVLRDMRIKGLVKYEVVSRKESRYRVLECASQ